MTQEPNIERIRRSFEIFNRTGEIRTDHVAADFELRQASSIIDTAGVFSGPDALRHSLLELQESFEDLRFDPEEILETPDGRLLLLIHVRARGRGSGIDLDNHIAWVWTMCDDKAVRCVIYEEQAEALEAVGLGSGSSPRSS